MSEDASTHAAGDGDVIDFQRSFCHYQAEEGAVWIRVGLECSLEVFDRSTGQSDRYLLSVRTQTGLRTTPHSDVEDPGYDFWFVFGDPYVYIRRALASSYGDSSSRMLLSDFANPGSRIKRVAATPLPSGVEIGEALRRWSVLVARSEFLSADGTRGVRIEYPIKWADGNPDGTFRVETGPVLLLDPERARVGAVPEVGDFQWAYLDFRSLDETKLFLERPTPILSGTHWRECKRARTFLDRLRNRFFPDQHGLMHNPRLTQAQREVIEQRLFSGWEPPIPAEALRKVFERDHYSHAEHRPIQTRLFALEA